MTTIYKYQLAIKDEVQGFMMPRGAKILHVGMQGGTVCLWALVVPPRFGEERLFRVFGTGHDLGAFHEDDHVGSVVIDPFVWHVFEVPQ